MPPPEQSMTSTPRGFSSFDKATLCVGEGGRGHAAGVANLDGGNRALGLDNVGDAHQAGDKLIVP